MLHAKIEFLSDYLLLRAVSTYVSDLKTYVEAKQALFLLFVYFVPLTGGFFILVEGK